MLHVAYTRRTEQLHVVSVELPDRLKANHIKAPFRYLLATYKYCDLQLTQNISCNCDKFYARYYYTLPYIANDNYYIRVYLQPVGN